MINTILAFSALTLSATQGPIPLSCAVAAEPAVASAGNYDFAGSRYGFCCPGCPSSFATNPHSAIVEAIKGGRTIGESLYDPVSGVLFTKDVKKVASIDFKSTRFWFSSEGNKAKFEANPTIYGVAPEKEAMYCSVMGHGLKGYATAGAYADHDKVRYYFCCPDCLAQFKADPAKYAKSAEKYVAVPKASKSPKAGS